MSDIGVSFDLLSMVVVAYEVASMDPAVMEMEEAVGRPPDTMHITWNMWRGNEDDDDVHPLQVVPVIHWSDLSKAEQRRASALGDERFGTRIEHSPVRKYRR